MCLAVLLPAAFSATGCSSHSPEVRVPPVDTTNLGAALEALAKAHLRVELTGFGPLPNGYTLDGAGVADQEPEAPALVKRGSVVRLTMGVNPIPSPVARKRHPPFVVIPRLVGLSWRRAQRRIPEDGFWVQIGRVPALGPIAPDDVYSAYVVTGQSPAPGTRLPYGGVLLKDGGYRPSTVHLTIGTR